MSGDRRKIAFLILAHGDAELLLQTCDRLKDHVVFIHVDAKAADFPIHRFDNIMHVTVIKQRHVIHWAGYGMVEATLSLMRAALATGEVLGKYVLLSGTCYPIKPILSLEALFAGDGERNYLDMTEVGQTLPRRLTARRWRMEPFLPWAILAKSTPLAAAERRVRRLYNKISKLFRRRIEREIGMSSFFGCSWWALSHDCVRYVLAFLNEHPEVSKAYRSTSSPDEQIFHTIVGNSPFAAITVGAPEEGVEPSPYRAPLHLVHPTPARWFGDTPEDFALAQGSDRYFMRKVSSQRNAVLLRRVDEELL
jgi:hypothetical protein